MNRKFPYSEFLLRFPTDESCLEEFKKLKYPNGVYCKKCRKTTKHYKVGGRTAYACKNCRNQVFPLAGTIFEKTTTPLRIWFYAIFLLTHTRAAITIKQLQREIGVTYKTAWKMYKNIRYFMEQNNGDLLTDYELLETNRQKSATHRWLFFSKLEITVTQKSAAEE